MLHRIFASNSRLAAALIMIALAATACAGSTPPVAVSAGADDPGSTLADSANTEANADAEPETQSDSEPQDAPGLTLDPALTGDPDAPLIRTTESDEPFDLTGGTSSSSEGVIVEEITHEDLPGGAASGSSRWSTDWTLRTINYEELLPGLRGVDTRDGIPPIDNPAFENVTQAGEWLSETEPGALVRINGEARFYPLAILTRHEIVNDRFGEVPVAVTFCPLCNTAIAYDRRVDGQVLRFGVSGLLRKSDLVMWDDQTDSLWQQISGEGIVGTYAGTKLEPLSTAIVSYGQFASSFPDGLSLSRNTGLGTDYGRNPYTGYSSLATPFLFDGEPDPRLPALSRVVGVFEDYGIKAYPFEELNSARVINDEIGGEPVVVFWADGTTDALDKSSIADSQAIGSAVAYRPFATDDAADTLTFTANADGTFADDQTGSTWSITGVAVAGELAGSELATVTHKNEFWFAFAGFFPEAPVFSL